MRTTLWICAALMLGAASPAFSQGLQTPTAGNDDPPRGTISGARTPRLLHPRHVRHPRRTYHAAPRLQAPGS